MAARSIASLTLTFGLVSIPVRLYPATEHAAAVHFHLLAPDGSRVRQQYVSAKSGEVVERSDLVKGYEFEKDRFVMFEPDELKQLEERCEPDVDIVAFVPEKSVDPVYYDKCYLLAPDKRGGKPYALLAAAMRESGRCALARWCWRSRRHVVQIRPDENGLVLQQLLYSDEVRSPEELDIEPIEVSRPELALALKLIDQISQDAYDPQAYQDEERKRVLSAIDAKIAGRRIVETAPAPSTGGARVINLMEALRASIGSSGKNAPSASDDKENMATSTARRDSSESAEAKPARAKTPATKSRGTKSGATNSGATKAAATKTAARKSTGTKSVDMTTAAENAAPARTRAASNARR